MTEAAERKPILRGDGDLAGAVLRCGIRATPGLATRQNEIAGIHRLNKLAGFQKGKMRVGGQPILKDRWTICRRRAVRSDVGGRDDLSRELHPAFEDFNNASLFEEPISDFPAVLFNASEEECFRYERGAVQLPGSPFKMHPAKRTICHTLPGDEWETAVRLYGIGEEMAVKPPKGGKRHTEGVPADEHWYKLDCPGRQCEFSIAGACGVRSWLYIMPRWPDRFAHLPVIPLLYFNRSWYSSENEKTFFNKTEKMAFDLNMERFSFMGFPVLLTLGPQENRKLGRIFPVCDLVQDGIPGNIFQQQRIEIEAGGGEVPLLLAANLEPETDRDTIESDVRDLPDPAVPATLFPVGEGE